MEADYGTSAYHQPYNSTTSFVYDLPIGQGRKWLTNASPVVDALLGGWQLSGINTITAGEVTNLTYAPGATFVVSGIQQDFRGANNYRANLNGDPLEPEATRTITNWLSRTNVTAPSDPSQPFGNAPRNAFRGPYFWQVDFVAAKRFPMPWRDGNVEFRIETFNLFNRTNLRPNANGNFGNRSNAAFGIITDTYVARQLQLGVKVNF
jgi:hypothetical protein